MFELPDAKRVRRADLNDDEASGEDESYDAELQARLNAQIAKSLGLDETDPQPKDLAVTPSHLTGNGADADSAEAGAGDEEDADIDGFEFRLFSSTRPSQKVVLEEDVGLQGDGGLAFPRPASYYRLTNLTVDKKQQYAFAAVSGDDILARSKDPVWGIQLPWRVTIIAVARKRRPGESACISEEVAAQTKAKPSKKQRISLRKRAKLREETEKVEAQKLMVKEEHTKDKKKRMNRLKKLRKRAKSKQEKAVAKAGEAEACAADSGDMSAGSE
ncbi:hypothetical protein EDB81DRAFT_275881 [Dactylonectria macrodidyma]|uniref:Uncharacterized protein n=1 Tax=Dactylonectria macrodidyma TaxID=307937 RepID=A0A9P9FMK0_9HYPO|nr:hypothetical protein EDB81DRAFT_275881 [Dactylonectria macrodidyma]